MKISKIKELKNKKAVKITNKIASWLFTNINKIDDLCSWYKKNKEMMQATNNKT